MESRDYNLMPLAELSRELGTPYNLLYRMVQSGAIAPHAKAGMQLLFDPRRLQELLAPLRDQVTANRFLLLRQRLMRLHRKNVGVVGKGFGRASSDRHDIPKGARITPLEAPLEAAQD